MNATEQKLLNDYQRDFPLIGEPFQRIANQLGADVGQILNRLARLLESGVISRIGPVFRPNTIGASTLAAMSVPASELVDVATRISAYPEVNHNYEREHAVNLWFVVNTVSARRRDAVLRRIEWETGHGVMSLPLVRDYHINLGFELDFSDPGRRIHKSHPDEEIITCKSGTAVVINQKVFHGNGHNTSNEVRSMIAVAYRPAWAGPIDTVEDWPLEKVNTLPFTLTGAHWYLN